MNSNFFDEVIRRLGGEKQIRLSLEPLSRALEEAGHPEKTVQSLVIAGTNGKGSTTLWISQALRLHGFKVATYLSPHLQSVRERFLDQLQPWSEERLQKRFQEALGLAEKWKLTYFEFLTLVFFLDSRENQPDFNILEVGMGGRLDATNVTEPKGVVLTNISWDHSEYLGDSLAKILQEKMGVFRKGVPVISGVQEPPLLALLTEKCQELGSSLFLTHQVSRKSLTQTWKGQEIEVDGKAFTITNPSRGSVENAVTAYSALTQWFPEVSLSTLKQAFSTVVNPGRMEVVQENPRVILSGDHNEAGMLSLAATLRGMGAQDLYILCGFSPDKEAKKMLEILKPFARKLVLTQLAHPRGEYPKYYSELAPFEPDAHRALKTLMSEMNQHDTLLVTGSLYLVGELRSQWKQEVGFQLTCV